MKVARSSRRAVRQQVSAAVVVAPRPGSDRSPAVTSDHPGYEPPFLGARVVPGVFLDEIIGYIDEDELWRTHWRVVPTGVEVEADYRRRVRRLLRDRLAAARKRDLFEPRVDYGYFPANSDGNEIVIWQDAARTGERTRLEFPRQVGSPRISVADYVKPVGQPDYVAFQIVTLGDRLSELGSVPDPGQDRGHLPGLGIALQDALAEYWHRRIRIEWGFAAEDGPSLRLLFRQFYRGGRYPLAGNEAAVVELLAADRIGVSMVADGVLRPRLTTASLIVHHPQAGGLVVE